MPKRFRLTLAYDGFAYAGFQEQPGKTTVQSALEGALARVLGEKARVVPSGRTDAGVHALAQVCHVDVKSEKAAGRLGAPNFRARVNGVLPEGLAVTAIRPAPQTFHARKSATLKTYRYFILISPTPNPFLARHAWRLGRDLDVAAMRRAAGRLIGRHDFSSFCASDSGAGDKTRELTGIVINNRSPAPFFTLKGQKFIQITATGKGFLKQMVRILVGTLVDVGRGKTPPEKIAGILAGRDRRLAGRTAPAHGLHLVGVKYGRKA